jgi:3alpha(or 20beta)-hydroxysteroid dehydrogenase
MAALESSAATTVSQRLAGKLIVVTGAARGQGEAEVRALAEAGATVIACDLAFGPSADGHASAVEHALDVTDEASWIALRTRIESEFSGVLHGLINNAGVTSRVRLPDVDLADWNRVLAVNLTGPMLGIKTLVPVLADGASIVNVGSIAGLTGHYTAAYTASKWGLRGLTQTAATELGPRGIRVNAVHPGFIHTPMTASAPVGFLDANIAVTPLARGGQPREVADLMIFLMSEESRFISGADIPIDGGQVSGGVAKSISEALRSAAAREDQP